MSNEFHCSLFLPLLSCALSPFLSLVSPFAPFPLFRSRTAAVSHTHARTHVSKQARTHANTSDRLKRVITQYASFWFTTLTRSVLSHSKTIDTSFQFCFINVP